MSEVTPVAHDEAAVWHVGKPAEDAFTEAEKIAARKEYTPQYKVEEIAKLFESARAEVENRYRDTLRELDEEQPKLEAKSRLPIAPKDIDGHLLAYTRDALAAQSRAGGMTTVKALWEQAIADKDAVAARVFIDFARTWKYATGTNTGGELRGGSIPFPQNWYDDLRARSLEFLLPEDGRKALAKLQKNTATRNQVGAAWGKAKMLVNPKFNIDGEGKLINGAQAEHTRRVRAMF